MIKPKPNRRSFLRTSTAVTLGALPSVVYRGAIAAETPSTDRDGRILVVIQMSGGNDGINTVVPFADEGYSKHRDKLRLANDRLIKIDDSVALHPSMRGAADLLDDGRLAIVQGVGYPNPSRSHDTSMAIWHSAQIGNENTLRTHGWLGRAMDAVEKRESMNHDPQMILLGDESQPLAIQSRRSTAITLSNLTDLQLMSQLPSVEEAKQVEDTMQVSLGANDLGQFVHQTMRNASTAASSLEQTIDQAEAVNVTYPANRLGRRMKSISTLIKGGFETPIYYAIQSGYDTHAAQLYTHSRLLREFSGAIKAFFDDLDAAGLSKRVCVMGFSEFGRRIAENGSAGTDHGTAGPVFVAGDQLNAGIFGSTSSLLEPVDGDLKMSVDFRSVYRELTSDWLGVDDQSTSGPGKRQQHLGIFDV